MAGARQRVWEAAQLVVQHLNTQAATLLTAGREWWQRMAKVAFVPATLGLPGSHRARQVLTRCVTAGDRAM